MGNFFVIEARRLLPLLFLLILLVSLSVYDNFFRIKTVTTPEEPLDFAVSFVTTDSGMITEAASFNLVYSEDEWEAMQKELRLNLPEYPFNAAHEIALFALNSEIQDVRIFPQGREHTQVRVNVVPRTNYYHVVTMDRAQVGQENVYWVFADDDGTILEQFTQENDDTEDDITGLENGNGEDEVKEK